MDQMYAASDSLRSYPWVRSTLLQVWVSPSSSLKLPWVLRALGAQPYCVLGQQNLLDGCSGMPCRTSMSYES